MKCTHSIINGEANLKDLQRIKVATLLNGLDVDSKRITPSNKESKISDVYK